MLIWLGMTRLSRYSDNISITRVNRRLNRTLVKPHAKELEKLSTKQVPKGRYRFARYGPTDHYEDAPAAGMCISVFALVKSKKKKGVLLGLPKPDERWINEWISSWKNYTDKDLAEAYKQWRLPSTYLREGEHPETALRRIMEDQLGIGDYSLAKKGPQVFSYTAPSDWYPGNNHWDLAFVYDVRVRGKSLKDMPRWWQELDFVRKKKDLLSKDYGWNDDFMRDLLGLNDKPRGS